MHSTDGMDIITIDQILERYRTWGIPHFQRGSVWSSGNVAALLESLYHDTPCGSLIVWDRDNPDDGVPLVPGHACTQLIIDGQQRVRSLYAAFRGHDQTFEAEEDSVEGAEPGDSPDLLTGRLSWAINLNRVSEFQDLLAAPDRRVHAMFVLIPDPAYTEQVRLKKISARKASLDPKRAARYMIPESQYKYNFVLLSHFNENHFDQLLSDRLLFLKGIDGRPIDADHGRRRDILAKFDWLSKKVREMKGRRLFLKVLEPAVELEQAVQVFIRINSGGRPVQEEERAFSILVQSSDETSPAIKRMFSAVHKIAAKRRSPHESIEHDEALARMNERGFGFKLFIRVFILAVSYHTGRSVGSSGLSFGVIRDRRFLAMLDNDGDLYRTLWDVTSRTVIAMRNLLRRQLNLDSLQFLPDSMSLVPLFLLMIKYPGILDASAADESRIAAEYEAGIAQLALLMLLRDPSGQQVMNWANAVLDSEDDAASVIDFLAQESKLDRKRLAVKLASANSLTNRYVLLMYALERRKGARDFSYRENNLDGEAFRLPERLVEEDAEPEKQHLVPYSLLATAYNLASGTRASTSEINNIGNITYISRIQNSWEGLSDRLLKLKADDELNLAAHFVDGSALAAYQRVLRLEKRGQATGRPLRVEYERWMRRRQKALMEGFVEWAGGLRDKWNEQRATQAQVGRVGVEPTMPLGYELTSGRALAHLIRTLDCLNPFEVELVKALAQPGWKLESEEVPVEPVPALMLRFELGRHAIVTGVTLSRDALVLPAIDHDAARTLQMTDPESNLEPLREALGQLCRLIERKRAARRRKRA